MSSTARLAMCVGLSLLASACDTAGFRDAYMSLDSAGKRKRDHFFTDTEGIYCFGEMASGVDDVTVSAVLRAKQIYDPRNGDAIDVDFRLATKDIAPGAGKDISVSFMLERQTADEPYIAGKFVCEMSIDGELVEQLPFEVAFPACPEAPIVSGALCAGFVVQSSRCPGALDNDCSCGEDGVWQCR